MGDEDDVYAFCSVSSDGRVASWTIVKNELQCADMAVLLSVPSTPVAAVEPTVFTKSCGTCMSFSPFDSTLFLVGTEEGAIRSCTTAYGSKYLQSYLVGRRSTQYITMNRRE